MNVIRIHPTAEEGQRLEVQVDDDLDWTNIYDYLALRLQVPRVELRGASIAVPFSGSVCEWLALGAFENVPILFYSIPTQAMGIDVGTQTSQRPKRWRRPSRSSQIRGPPCGVSRSKYLGIRKRYS